MVTISNQTTHYNGLSTDTKPTGGRNGDAFCEIDTGKIYKWNAAGDEWVEQPASGGSGGGTSSSKYTATVETRDNIFGAFFDKEDVDAIVADFFNGKVVRLELPEEQAYLCYHCVLEVTAVSELINGTYNINFYCSNAGSYTVDVGGLQNAASGDYYVEIYVD